MKFKFKEYFKVKVKSIPFRLDKEIILYSYALDKYPESFSISDVSKDLKWPKSTVKRILDKLMERGVIEKYIVDNEVKYCIRKPIRLGLMKLSIIPFRKLPITLFLATFTTFIWIGIIMKNPPYNILYPVTLASLGILMIFLWLLTYLFFKYEPI